MLSRKTRDPDSIRVRLGLVVCFFLSQDKNWLKELLKYSQTIEQISSQSSFLAVF